jgi:hypothetical protein
VFFTTISAAIAQAATLTPVSGNPVMIAIAPGTYTENPVLQSWIFLAALTPAFAGVTINGTLTWAPTGAVAEAINVYNLIVVDAVTITTTGKSAGKTSTLFNNCEVGGTFNGRSASGATQDFINFQGCTAQPVSWTFCPTSGGCAVEWLGGRVAPMTFDNACVFDFSGATTNPAASGTWSVNGTTVGKFTGTNFLALGIAAAAGTSVAVAGCYDSGALTGAGAFDVRGTNYNGNANLTGITGTANRTTWTQSFGSTVAGANLVTLTPAYPTPVTYNVSLAYTAVGVAVAGVTITGKTGGSFVLTEPAGASGNTYDITVTND